jgi:DNA-binding NtrC family response regulator
VLLAEDEPSLREAARRLLERAGFRVVATSNGLDALDELRAAPDAFDVMLTDVMMPGMGGVELIQHSTSLAPALPVVLMSGYADIPTASPHTLCDATLEKPFTADALVSTIRSVMRTTHS